MCRISLLNTSLVIALVTCSGAALSSDALTASTHSGSPAKNYANKVSMHVDPRTGEPSASIPLAHLPGHGLARGFSLALSYSHAPISDKKNPYRVSTRWAFSLPYYSARTFRSSAGGSFFLGKSSNDNGTIVFNYNKLKNVILKTTSRNTEAICNLTASYPDGHQEIFLEPNVDTIPTSCGQSLNYPYLVLKTIKDSKGHEIHFHYTQSDGNYVLSAISDNYGNQVTIGGMGSSPVTITSTVAGQVHTTKLNVTGLGTSTEQLSSVSVTADGKTYATQFSYYDSSAGFKGDAGVGILKSIRSQTGSVYQLSYGRMVSKNNPMDGFPVVIQECHSADGNFGVNDAFVKTNYAYGTDSDDGHPNCASPTNRGLVQFKSGRNYTGYNGLNPSESYSPTPIMAASCEGSLFCSHDSRFIFFTHVKSYRHQANEIGTTLRSQSVNLYDSYQRLINHVSNVGGTLSVAPDSGSVSTSGGHTSKVAVSYVEGQKPSFDVPTNSRQNQAGTEVGADGKPSSPTYTIGKVHSSLSIMPDGEYHGNTIYKTFDKFGNMLTYKNANTGKTKTIIYDTKNTYPLGPDGKPVYENCSSDVKSDDACFITFPLMTMSSTPNDGRFISVYSRSVHQALAPNSKETVYFIGRDQNEHFYQEGKNTLADGIVIREDAKKGMLGYPLSNKTYVWGRADQGQEARIYQKTHTVLRPLDLEVMPNYRDQSGKPSKPSFSLTPHKTFTTQYAYYDSQDSNLNGTVPSAQRNAIIKATNADQQPSIAETVPANSYAVSKFVKTSLGKVEVKGPDGKCKKDVYGNCEYQDLPEKVIWSTHYRDGASGISLKSVSPITIGDPSTEKDDGTLTAKTGNLVHLVTKRDGLGRVLEREARIYSDADTYKVRAQKSYQYGYPSLETVTYQDQGVEKTKQLVTTHMLSKNNLTGYVHESVHGPLGHVLSSWDNAYAPEGQPLASNCEPSLKSSKGVNGFLASGLCKLGYVTYDVEGKVTSKTHYQVAPGFTPPKSGTYTVPAIAYTTNHQYDILNRPLAVVHPGLDGNVSPLPGSGDGIQSNIVYDEIWTVPAAMYTDPSSPSYIPALADEYSKNPGQPVKVSLSAHYISKSPHAKADTPVPPVSIALANIRTGHHIASFKAVYNDLLPVDPQKWIENAVQVAFPVTETPPKVMTAAAFASYHGPATDAVSSYFAKKSHQYNELHDVIASTGLSPNAQSLAPNTDSQVNWLTSTRKYNIVGQLVASISPELEDKSRKVFYRHYNGLGQAICLSVSKVPFDSPDNDDACAYNNEYAQGQFLGGFLTNKTGDALTSVDGAGVTSQSDLSIDGTGAGHVDALSQTTRLGFNPVGQLTRVNYGNAYQGTGHLGGNAPAVSYRYNSKDYRFEQMSQGDYSMTQEHNLVGRVVSQTVSHGPGNDYTYGRTYSPYGGVLAWQDSLDQHYRYHYGVLGMTDMSFLDHNQVRQTIQITRDHYGRAYGRTRVNMADGLQAAGVAITRQFNRLGQLTTLTFTPPSGAKAEPMQYRYRYNSAGALIESTVQLQATAQPPPLIYQATFAYQYNRQNQLTGYTASGNPLLFARDGFGHIISAQQFSYTRNGSLKMVTSTFVTKSGDKSGGDTATYAYDLTSGYPDRILSIQHSNQQIADYINQMGGGKNYHYDRLNNTLVDGFGNHYFYNDLNQMVKFISNPRDGKPASVTYGYDYGGILAYEKATLDQQTAQPVNYFYSGTKLLHKRQKNPSADRFIYASFLPGIAKIVTGATEADANGTAYYYNAHQGVAAVYDSQNELKHHYSYSPYGLQNDYLNPTKAGTNPAENREALDITKNSIGFSGQSKDSATGMMMLGGYRAYDPAVGSFMKVDSMGPFTAGGSNSFAYAFGNPLAYYDPSGHFDILASLISVVVGAATFGLVTPMLVAGPGSVNSMIIGSLGAGATSGAAGAAKSSGNHRVEGEAAARGVVSSAAGLAVSTPLLALTDGYSTGVAVAANVGFGAAAAGAGNAAGQGIGLGLGWQKHFSGASLGVAAGMGAAIGGASGIRRVMPEDLSLLLGAAADSAPADPAAPAAQVSLPPSARNSIPAGLDDADFDQAQDLPNVGDYGDMEGHSDSGSDISIPGPPQAPANSVPDNVPVLPLPDRGAAASPSVSLAAAKSARLALQGEITELDADFKEILAPGSMNEARSSIVGGDTYMTGPEGGPVVEPGDNTAYHPILSPRGAQPSNYQTYASASPPDPDEVASPADGSPGEHAEATIGKISKKFSYGAGTVYKHLFMSSYATSASATLPPVTAPKTGKIPCKQWGYNPKRYCVRY